MTRTTFAWSIGLLAILSVIATVGLFYVSARLESDAAGMRVAIPMHSASLAHEVEAQTRHADVLTERADTLRQISMATAVATLFLGATFVFLRVVPTPNRRHQSRQPAEPPNFDNLGK